MSVEGGGSRTPEPASAECSVTTQRASCVFCKSRSDAPSVGGVFPAALHKANVGGWGGGGIPPVRGSEPTMKVSHPERSSGLDVHGHEHGDGSWKYPEASAFSKVAAGCVSVPGRMMSELESEGGGGDTDDTGAGLSGGGAAPLTSHMGLGLLSCNLSDMPA